MSTVGLKTVGLEHIIDHHAPSATLLNVHLNECHRKHAKPQPCWAPAVFTQCHGRFSTQVNLKQTTEKQRRAGLANCFCERGGAAAAVSAESRSECSSEPWRPRAPSAEASELINPAEGRPTPPPTSPRLIGPLLPANGKQLCFWGCVG